jgi:hypothetical protein
MRRSSLILWFAFAITLLGLSSIWTYVGLFAESGFPLPFVRWPVGPLASQVLRSAEILWSGLAVDFAFWGLISLVAVMVIKRFQRR